jgi:haloalkane dehalogenase
MMPAPQYLKLEHCEVAYRVVGSGAPLLLVHGYPLSGLTYRHMVPLLAKHFTCYIPDLLGAGETRWDRHTDFSFHAQAGALKRLVDSLHLESYSIVAHDTGGTIARALALSDPGRLKHLVLMGTEIPGHRPPWIEFFQKTANERSTWLFRKAMQSKFFRESSAGFGGCFHNRALMHGEFYDLMIAPVVASEERARGLIRYLKGIDWQMVDSFKTSHARITTPTLLIWGEQDPVFPVEVARRMVPQLGNCKGFVAVPQTRLFVHEEAPKVVAHHILDFMVKGKTFH